MSAWADRVWLGLVHGCALLLAPVAGTTLYGLSPDLLWAACAATGICAAAVITPAIGPDPQRARQIMRRTATAATAGGKPRPPGS